MTDLGRFAPELALAGVFGVVAGLMWARLAQTGILLGIATATSLGAILAVTLAPVGPLPEVGVVIGVCDLRRWGPGTLDELLVIGEASLNVALFMPLGVCIGLHGVPVVRRLALASAATLPFVIELVQLKLPDLGRYCDSMDIADNELGLVLGFAAGALLLAAGRRLRSAGGPEVPTPLA